MAVTRDRVRSVSSRDVARATYQLALGLSAVALVVLRPPHFDLSLRTIISVCVVGSFLALSERPMRATGGYMAPMTAIIAAATFAFGWWTLVLTLIASFAVRIRVGRPLFAFGSAAQFGSAIVSTYAAVGTAFVVGWAAHMVPAYLTAAVSLIGIVVVGLLWQSVNNATVLVSNAIAGERVAFTQLFRTGVIASIYAYLLVAMYTFGGIIGAAVFYIVVAQNKVVNTLLGVSEELQKLERAREQAQTLTTELMHFMDSDQLQFNREVQHIAQFVARHLGMPKRDINNIGLAAQLHEIGKCSLAPKLRLGRSLNEAEKAQHDRYPRLGAIILRSADSLIPSEVADWVESHNEHYDGTGYPRGLKGEKIPVQARLIGIARDYVRLLTGYDGIETVTKEKALATLRERSGSQYDPNLVEALYQLVS